MKDARFSKIIIVFIILCHLTGIIGLINLKYRSLFLLATPFQLWVMFLVSILVIGNFTRKFFGDISILLVVSFLVEYLGVRTGKIFGNYDYQNTSLGFTLLGIPLVIGPNWVALLFSTASMVNVQKGLEDLPVLAKALISSLLMVFLDFLMEPVAVFFRFWHWNNDSYIPLQNYWAWFMFSFLCHCFFQYRHSLGKNIPLQVLYISQGIFFLVLNFCITHFKI